MKTFRLIRLYPGSAVYNMAVDEEIFNRYLNDRVPVLRVYSWKSPSFTYGVSQHPENEIRLNQCNSDGIGIAQRMTGGGILFHDDEITYSLACSKEDVGEPQESFVSYRQICAFLISFYKSFGLGAKFALESEGFKGRSTPSTLCSASYEKYDIVINGKKIGGNAQKRKRQAIFQHGSIPCRINWGFLRSYLKVFPDNMPAGITSLYEELAFVPDKSILEQRLIDSFANVFGVQFIEEKVSFYETNVA